jgi:hypothetical protein
LIEFNGLFYALLGAGTLRAQPYIQYGSDIIEYQTITTSFSLNTVNPVLVRNVTVENGASFTVTSTHTSSSPVCTHSEIVIRPETCFQQGSEVDIKAQ